MDRCIEGRSSPSRRGPSGRKRAPAAPVRWPFSVRKRDVHFSAATVRHRPTARTTKRVPRTAAEHRAQSLNVNCVFPLSPSSTLGIRIRGANERKRRRFGRSLFPLRKLHMRKFPARKFRTRKCAHPLGSGVREQSEI